ncbi:protein STAY-GREEN, chloroplastic-like [Alnus glutinosa]|uniref:protein STAY-GREEN, chloroplastic-like n=1 Tax=Alnus glutinosa TaxID=3517 RepID=UPI002D79D5EC|nr:protein STAY-GREEN, chloroplastic-like [Alnus glutinosa]
MKQLDATRDMSTLRIPLQYKYLVSLYALAHRPPRTLGHSRSLEEAAPAAQEAIIDRTGSRSWAWLQGWYNRLQRDEMVAEWKKVQGKMSLHVHCHISGGHFLLDLCARLRYFIFCKELPVVLKAFIDGDVNLFNNHPELQEALVWVYFHSNIPEFNKVECWGPVKEAAAPTIGVHVDKMPKPCQEDCSYCFPPMSLIQRPAELPHDTENSFGAQQSFLQQR